MLWVRFPLPAPREKRIMKILAIKKKNYVIGVEQKNKTKFVAKTSLNWEDAIKFSDKFAAFSYIRFYGLKAEVVETPEED